MAQLLTILLCAASLHLIQSHPCTGRIKTQPCKCFIDEFSCQDLSNCDWKFEECIDIETVAPLTTTTTTIPSPTDPEKKLTFTNDPEKKLTFVESDCTGPVHQQPCQCFDGEYHCLYFDNCDWQFNTCVDLSLEPETYINTAATTSTTNSECNGPEHTQPCLCFDNQNTCNYFEKCEWRSECLELGTTTTTTTTSTTSVPTSTESTQIINCGDTVTGKWTHEDIAFKLLLHSDTQSLEINACNSNYNTILKLYGPDLSGQPLYIDDNTCENGFGSSLIQIPEGLSEGMYYLLLSADSSVKHGKYELHVFCDISGEMDTQTSINSQHIMLQHHDKTECTTECDAFRVKMLYYGWRSEYTDEIYYDDGYHRRLQEEDDGSDDSGSGSSDQDIDSEFDDAELGFFNPEWVYYEDTNNDDITRRRMSDSEDGIVCYTYRIERMFSDYVCEESMEEVVLGLCENDEINYTDLDALIVKEYGGDIYEGYMSKQMTGIKINVAVDDKPVEFTLCMRDINSEGLLSHSVQYKRGEMQPYLCMEQTNDGLPCLNHSIKTAPPRPDTPVIEDVIKSHVEKLPENMTFSHVLQVTLVVALSVMIMVSVLYVFISAKKNQTKKVKETGLDWTEIKVSETGTMSSTTNYNDDDTEQFNDPLDIAEDVIDYNKILSPGNNDKNTVKIPLMEEPILETTKLLNETGNSMDPNVDLENKQSGRNVNDKTTVLSLGDNYNEFDVVTDDGYWNNADIDSDEISKK